MSAVHGLEEMVAVANRHVSVGEVSGGLAINTSRWNASSEGAVRQSFPNEQVDISRLAALVIPPTIADDIGFASKRVRSWISQRHAQGCIVCSVCGGTYLLAETGLLNGRTATTHWSLAPDIANRFPAVNFDTDRLLIDDGDIVTAGGMTAWMQLGLRMIERFLGTDVMLATAKFMLIDSGVRPQSYYASFSPRLDHNDSAILAVQQWLNENPRENVTLAALAGHARLTMRTFIRRFFRVTGMNPTEYCQRMRIDRSRDMLEKSRETIEEISWQCGYEDQGAYRRLFKRYLGITPGEYRIRLSVNPRPDPNHEAFWAD
jgi:transcriptional regulator GlxA family with amidase domain